MVDLRQPIEWNELHFVKSLDTPYREALRRVYDYVAPLLGTRPLGAEEFTDHDLRHSARVLERAAQILPSQTELNQPEIYILALSALLHDAGLWTRKDEALQLFESGELQGSPDISAEELAKVEELLADERLRWMGELALQRLVAWQHRISHPERLCSLVLNSDSQTGQTLRVLIGKEFVNAVATVSVAHSWSRERVLDEDELRDQQFGNEVVSLRFLATLLRLGDLLDLGEGRVSTLLWEYLAPLNHTSEAHWRKEATLQLERCSPDLIRIVGRFDVDMFGMAAAEAHRLAQDWLGMIRDEIEGVALVLNSRIETEHRDRLQFGRMNLDVSRVEANGLVLGGKVAFELPQDRVIELLSEEIYADKSIFIRELLQNAVDATRAQLIRDKRNGLCDAEEDLLEGEPWNWPKSITGNPRYQILVNTSGNDCPNDPHITFSIADQGLGMSLADIRNHFLQVGKSFYTTNTYRQEFSHTPISQFGIGFLSCLAVADRIEVTTRQHHETAALRLTLQKPSEYFIVEKINDAKPGTTVTLKITRKEMEALGLQSFPDRAVNFFSNSEEFCDAIVAVVAQWAAYLEFTLNIQGTLLEPRNPSTYVPDYIFQDNQRESMPVKVNSEDGRELARGRVFYEVFEDTHLPYFHRVAPQTQSVASSRGIGLSDGRISLTSHQLLVALDFRRLPLRSMTAGRMLRQGWSIFSFVGDMIYHELQALTVRELEAIDKELPVLWKLFLDRRMGTPNRELLKLPVRTEVGVTWESWEQISERHRRVLLVPFHVAWRGPWALPVPAVGIVNDRLHRLSNSTENDHDALAHSIQECNIVCVDGACSAYLWPPHAESTELELLTNSHTFLHTDLVTWKDETHPRRLQDAVPIDERLVHREELPEYDRHLNPWKHFGVQKYSRTNDGSITGLSARKVFESHSEWSLADREIIVSLKNTEDWV